MTAFPAPLEEAIVRGTDQDTEFAVWAARGLEGAQNMMVRLETMDTREAKSRQMG